MIRCFRRFERQFVYRINTATPLSIRYSVQTNGNRYGIFAANCRRHLPEFSKFPRLFLFPPRERVFYFHYSYSVLLRYLYALVTDRVRFSTVFTPLAFTENYTNEGSLKKKKKKERTTASSFKKLFIAARFVTAGRGWGGSEGQRDQAKIPGCLRARSRYALAKKLRSSIPSRFAKSKTKCADSCPGRRAVQPGFQVSTVSWSGVLGQGKPDSKNRENRRPERSRIREARSERRVARARSHDHPAYSRTER